MATIADAKLPVVQVVSLQTAGGAIKRVKPDGDRIRATCHPVQHVRARAWEDPALSDAAGQWTRSAWKNVEPHTRGFYVNEFNEDAGAHEGDVRRELRPHGGAQDEVRPWQPVPLERERGAGRASLGREKWRLHLRGGAGKSQATAARIGIERYEHVVDGMDDAIGGANIRLHDRRAVDVHDAAV